MKKNEVTPELTGAVMVQGEQFLGVREHKKIIAIFADIAENEQAVIKLTVKIARAYYDAGNILAAALKRFNHQKARLTAKAVADGTGFPERRICIALRIFKGFEHNPEVLGRLDLRDALKLIAPPPPSGEDGYNRIDLGGDPGQMRLDFGELFALPATGNLSLQNYRTVGDLVSEIIVVKRTPDNQLISKHFVRFFEDIPQNPALRSAFKTMSCKTQAAIEDYLAAIEQEEAQR